MLPVLGLLLCGSEASAAPELEIRAAPCAEEIRVQAREVPLGEILRALSKALDFRLDAKVALAEVVSFEGRGSPEQVLTQLMNGRNLILQSATSPPCAGRAIVSKVWVLPSGSAAAAVPANLPQAPHLGQPEAAPLGSHHGIGEEQWQQHRGGHRHGAPDSDQAGS